MGAFVYMLRCVDASYYVGIATGDDLTKRVTEHQIGAYPGSYTYSRRPVELVWSDHFDRIRDAIAAERQVKAGVAPRSRRSLTATGNSSSSLPNEATALTLRLEASLLRRHPEVLARRSKIPGRSHLYGGPASKGDGAARARRPSRAADAATSG